MKIPSKVLICFSLTLVPAVVVLNLIALVWIPKPTLYRRQSPNPPLLVLIDGACRHEC